MLFKKQFLLDVLDAGVGSDGGPVEDMLVGNSRWSLHRRMVFASGGKFYESNYYVGATECQDEGPYEYDGDEIECAEVRPTERSVTIYERVSD